MVRWSDLSDSDTGRLRREARSGSGSGSWLVRFSSGTEPTLRLLCDLRLVVERSDGSRLDFDFTDERRSGTTTTGMPPFLQISRRTLALDSELTVVLEA